ncbi:hypothetical protein CEXT_175961 [Caerostris extrusa]|uniref:Uncharacterized protein n=1 Tax=Caerostris extrusa TaxID=172846 RepID=A0AAV4NLX7_CAEEX|nr:hypothetical protein CEXT_175961 [Caerostris extrusa]
MFSISTSSTDEIESTSITIPENSLSSNQDDSLMSVTPFFVSTSLMSEVPEKSDSLLGSEDSISAKDSNNEDLIKMETSLKVPELTDLLPIFKSNFDASPSSVVSSSTQMNTIILNTMETSIPVTVDINTESVKIEFNTENFFIKPEEAISSINSVSSDSSEVEISTQIIPSIIDFESSSMHWSLSITPSIVNLNSEILNSHLSDEPSLVTSDISLSSSDTEDIVSSSVEIPNIVESSSMSTVLSVAESDEIKKATSEIINASDESTSDVVVFLE